MNRITLKIFLVGLFFAVSCSQDDETEPGGGTGLDYRNEMRNFVTGISQYAKSFSPGFLVIPQNGQELVTSDGNPGGTIAGNYLNAIDGHGREDLFYGYTNDDVPTPPEERIYIMSYLDRIKQAGKTILVTDYCYTPANMMDSYNQNNDAGYISFAADHRELDNIPSYPPVIFHQNQDTIHLLSDAKNFLFLINPVNYTKGQLIAAIRNTNYDLVIMDLFIGNEPFSANEIDSLKQKKDGERRLVICYMSIGEAENYRYYWQPEWNTSPPSWLAGENPSWPGNYVVRYWDKDWQNIIFGNDQSYTKKILNAHFDGVYLDLVDAFEYFELSGQVMHSGQGINKN